MNFSIAQARRRAPALLLASATLLAACAQAPTAPTAEARPSIAASLSPEDRNAFFIHAARTGAIDEVREYLKAGAQLDAFDTLDQTALIAAIDHKQIAVVQLLLDRGADTKLADHAGWTPLIHAVYFGADDDLLGLLLDHGADINARNDRGVTALYLAAASGRETQVQALLKRGADPKIETTSGYSALRVAQLRGYTRVVALLGGDPVAPPAPAGAKGSSGGG